MDQLEEKSSVLARTGSFYYRSLPEKPKNEANFMSHLTWQTKLFNLGDISQNLLLSGGYHKGNFKVLHFKDQDIDYFGLKSALQRRVMAYMQEDELVETPLRPKTNPEWDYTSIDTVLEVTWSQADLSEGIIVPSGVLKRVDLTIPVGRTSAGYLVLLVADGSGNYSVEAVSTSPGYLKEGKIRWLFKDEQLTGKATRIIITTSEDEQSARQEVTSIVNHLDNDSSVQAGSSIVEGVVPEIVFFLRGASVIENVITARPANLTISAVTGVMNEEGDIISDNSSVILFPTGNPEDKAIYSDVMRFGLSIDPDLWVTSIQTTDKRLIAGYDFFSEFGKLVFPVNPAQLFPDMTLMVYSFVKRTRNLYSYSLRLDDVYGPVDRVMHYYRVTQSPKAFYLATAQAVGFAVVREDCSIQKVLPFHGGCIYVTDKGIYETPYKHFQLPIGTFVEEGTVIGGDELFRLLLPSDEWPGNLGDLNLDGILPVKGLKAPDSPIRLYDSEGNYAPAYIGSEGALQAYWDYIRQYTEQSGAEPSSDTQDNTETVNAIQHVRTTVCPNKLLVACINYDAIPATMLLRLETFMQRELPVGSVLTTADMPITISEKDTIDKEELKERLDNA